MITALVKTILAFFATVAGTGILVVVVARLIAAAAGLEPSQQLLASLGGVGAAIGLVLGIFVALSVWDEATDW
jgi:Zn-dependent protease